MNEKNIPIYTYRDGEKTTKVCIESMHKVINRMISEMDKTYNDSMEILDSLDNNKYWLEDENAVIEGCIVVGTGVSQPCNGDVYDEQLGNEIAFKKAKLNANIKKYNLLWKLCKKQIDFIVKIDEELEKIDAHIYRDINDLRIYNEDYLKNQF